VSEEEEEEEVVVVSWLDGQVNGTDLRVGAVGRGLNVEEGDRQFGRGECWEWGRRIARREKRKKEQEEAEEMRRRWDSSAFVFHPLSASPAARLFSKPSTPSTFVNIIDIILPHFSPHTPPRRNPASQPPLRTTQTCIWEAPPLHTL